jgi:hypothetical protein
MTRTTSNTRPLHSLMTAAFALILAAPIATPVAAQAAADSALARARRFADGGNVLAGRLVIDSVLQTTPEGSPGYAEALYWRAVFSESAEQARRDYLRITLDFPLHGRAADATLRLAQQEFARGDRASARRYLERLALEHSAGPTATQGAFWMGRVLLEDGAVLEACAELARAKATARADDVELQGQITYYMQPCARARADSLVRADSTARAVADSARADSIARARSGGRGARSAATKGSKGTTKGASSGPAWSVQIAAYTQPEDAERLASKLRARGYEARVTEDRPYRVRIGRFGARAEAVALAEKVKAAKMAAIIVEAERP